MSENEKQLSTKCPHCGVRVIYTPGERDRYFPFCSRRCKLIDLGKWLEEEHRIEESLQERMPRGEGQPDRGGDER